MKWDYHLSDRGPRYEAQFGDYFVTVYKVAGNGKYYYRAVHSKTFVTHDSTTDGLFRPTANPFDAQKAALARIRKVAR